jgi:hypothetical protein
VNCDGFLRSEHTGSHRAANLTQIKPSRVGCMALVIQCLYSMDVRCQNQPDRQMTKQASLCYKLPSSSYQNHGCKRASFLISGINPHHRSDTLIVKCTDSEAAMPRAMSRHESCIPWASCTACTHDHVCSSSVSRCFFPTEVVILWNLFYYITEEYLLGEGDACTHSTVHTWRSEDNLKELILSFYPVGPEGQTQGFRLGGTHCVMSLLSVPWWMLCSCITFYRPNFFSFLFYFLKIYLFISCMWVHCCYLQTHQKRALDPHYRWLWATMWLLGIELRTSGRAVSVLNHWAISPAHCFLVVFVVVVFKWMRYFSP